MIATIRISGQVGLNKDIVETLNRLRIRKKYTCVVLNSTPENIGMIKKVKNNVAFGEIDEKTFEELVKKRGQKIEKEKDIGLDVMKTLKWKENNLKPFFRLHPPRGGIDSKKHFGVTKKAVLGDNKKEINNLIKRML